MFRHAQRKKFWRFRYMWLGREKMLRMGEFPDTSVCGLPKLRTAVVGYCVGSQAQVKLRTRTLCRNTLSPIG